MSSTRINNRELPRSNTISSTTSNKLPGVEAEVESQHGADDVLELDRSDAQSTRSLPAAPLASAFGSVKKTGSITLSNKIEPSEEHGIAIEAAKAKGLSALVRDVSVKTSGARAATKYTTIAGIGLAFGLLFAGQPFAVMLVAPAFAALGAVIAYVMRTYQNNKADASIDAFVELMKAPTEDMKNSPDFAEAQKLNAFLTDSFTTFAKKEIVGLTSGIKNPLAGIAAKLAAAKAALEEQQNRGIDDDEFSVSDENEAQELDSKASSAAVNAQVPQAETTAGWLNDFKDVEHTPSKKDAAEAKALTDWLGEFSNVRQA